MGDIKKIMGREMKIEMLRPVVARPISRRLVAEKPSIPFSPTPILPPRRRASSMVFWLLVSINVINYLDRIIFAAIGPLLKADFHINDAQVGLAASAFLFIYTVAALPLGVMADRGSRTKIIAFGVAAWSLATWYTAISHTFPELFLGRAVLGIGEASYVPAGTALLAAYFASSARARVMSLWGASTLIGTAAGFVVGGVIAQSIGWRWAFVICGLPGLVLAVLMWRTQDRRVYDAADAQVGSQEMLASIAAPTTRARSRQQTSSWRAALGTIFVQMRAILRSPTARLNIVLQALGLCVTTPAVIFIPIYLQGHFHLNILTTDLVAGGVLIPGGVLGAVLGGFVADALTKRFVGGRMLAAALGYACAIPCLIAALLVPSLLWLMPLAFLATAFMNVYNGPLNAVLQDIIPGALRASAAAIIMTLAHLLGDVPSPTIVGWLESVTHLPISQALLLYGVPALTLAAFLAWWGAGVYAREMQRREVNADATMPALAAEPDVALAAKV